MTEVLPDPTVPTNEGGGGTGGSNNGTVVSNDPASAEYSTIQAAIAASTTGTIYITPGVYTEATINFPNTFKWTIYAYGATITAQFLSDINTNIEIFGGQFVYTRTSHLERQYYNFDLGTGSIVVFHDTKLRCTGSDVGIYTCSAHTVTFNNCEFYSDRDTIANNSGSTVTLNNCSMIGSSEDTYYLYLDSGSTMYVYNTKFTSTGGIGSIQFNADGPTTIYAYNCVLPDIYAQGLVDMRLYNSVIPLINTGNDLTGTFICDGCTVELFMLTTLETGQFTNCSITTIDGTTGRNLQFLGCKLNFFRIANGGVSNTIIDNCEINSNLVLTAIDVGLVLQNSVMNSTSVINATTGTCRIYGCSFMNDASMLTTISSSIDNCIFKTLLYHTGGTIDISNCVFNRLGGSCISFESYSAPSVITINNCSFQSDGRCISIVTYFTTMNVNINHCKFINVSIEFCIYIYKIISNGTVTITDCSMSGSAAGIHNDDGTGGILVTYAKNTMSGGGPGYEDVEGSASSTSYVAF